MNLLFLQATLFCCCCWVSLCSGRNGVSYFNEAFQGEHLPPRVKIVEKQVKRHHVSESEYCSLVILYKGTRASADSKLIDTIHVIPQSREIKQRVPMCLICTHECPFHPLNHCLREPLAWFNSLWPSDSMWQHRFRLTLAQVMACCLTAPSHYLNQHWLISEVQWQSPSGNFSRDTSAINHSIQLEN